MWVAPVLLIIVCSWGLTESRESLRDQLAMLRREQWRDKERIEALERKVVIREERGSSPHAIGDVIEEVRKEVEELTDELRHRQELEGVVEELQGQIQQGLVALRHMASEIGNLKSEQQKMRKTITALQHVSSKFDNHAEKKSVTSNDPFEEEGSGDLAAELFLPVDAVPKESKPTSQPEQDLRKVLEEQKLYFQKMENQVSKERLDLKKHLEETQNQVQRTQKQCEQLASNATEKYSVATLIVEDLDERFNHLRRDVSRLEFNIAQSQAALDVVTQDRAADKDVIRNLRDEWNRAQLHIDQQHSRLVNLELLSTNLTLQRCKMESQVTSRELKLANMELWLSQADRRLEDTARRAEVSRRSDENVIRSLREAIVSVSRKSENMTEEVHQLVGQQEKTRHDLDKFVRQLPKDCSKASQSGINLIHVHGLGPVEALCDVDTEGGPWLVLQRRFNGSETFFRSWAEYQKGFGSLSSEFWVGNEILHRITSDQSPMKLRVDMWDVVGRYLFAVYEKFVVKSEEELYALEVGRHRGNATDALRHHSGMGFSTHDRDNDASSTHCAVHYTGGWWYQHCHRADLNGRYALGMTWYDEFTRDWVQLERVEMKMAKESSST